MRINLPSLYHSTYAIALIGVLVLHLLIVSCADHTFESLITELHQDGLTYCPVSPPKNIHTTCDTPSEITVQWETLSNATSYRIYRSTSKDGIYRLLFESTQDMYHDKTIASTGTYFYKVSSLRSQCNESPKSEPIEGIRCYDWTSLPIGYIEMEGMPFNPLVKVDSSNNLHLVYTFAVGSTVNEFTVDKTYLRYTVKQGAIWSEPIRVSTDSHTDIRAFDFTLTSTGTPVVVYSNALDSSPTNTIAYATLDGTGNSFDVEELGTGFVPSLAMDTMDHPHIAYQVTPDQQINYKTHDGSTWFTSQISSDGFLPSIQVDSTDTPAVIFCRDSATSKLYYAKKNGMSWDEEYITQSVWNPKFAIDTQDQPHIAYVDLIFQDLYHVEKVSGTWELGMVDRKGSVGYGLSLHCYSNNQWGISYADITNSSIKYAYHDALGLHIEEVETLSKLSSYVGEFAYHTTLDYGIHNEPYIFYFFFRGDSGFGLKYASFNNAGWFQALLNDMGNTINHIQMLVDQTNQIHILYYDSLSSGLMLAIGTPDSTLEELPFLWKRYLLAELTSPEAYFYRMQQDETGAIHISYQDDLAGKLYHGIWDGSSFTSAELIQRDIQTGFMYSEMYVESSNRIHFLFGIQDEQMIQTFNPIEYTVSDGTSHQFEPVGFDGIVHTPLEVDSEGEPHFMFIKNNPPILYHAYYQANSWKTELVQSLSWSSTFCIAPDGILYAVYLAYKDADHVILRFAIRDESGWEYHNIDEFEVFSLGNVSSHQIKIDSEGHIHLVYYNSSTKMLYYGRWTGVEFMRQTIATGTDVGVINQMVIDQQGNPIIAYYDKTADDILFAFPERI